MTLTNLKKTKHLRTTSRQHKDLLEDRRYEHRVAQLRKHKREKHVLKNLEELLNDEEARSDGDY